jgi:hypothetical protein
MKSTFISDLMAGGFSKLAGLKISGTVPMQEALVNEALDELVQNWSKPTEAGDASVPASQFLRLVRKLQIRAQEGVINVDFEIGV